MENITNKLDYFDIINNKSSFTEFPSKYDITKPVYFTIVDILNDTSIIKELYLLCEPLRESGTIKDSFLMSISNNTDITTLLLSDLDFFERLIVYINDIRWAIYTAYNRKIYHVVKASDTSFFSLLADPIFINISNIKREGFNLDQEIITCIDMSLMAALDAFGIPLSSLCFSEYHSRFSLFNKRAVQLYLNTDGYINAIDTAKKIIVFQSPDVLLSNKSILASKKQGRSYTVIQEDFTKSRTHMFLDKKCSGITIQYNSEEFARIPDNVNPREPALHKYIIQK